MRLLIAAVSVLALAACAPKPIEQMTYSESRELAAQLHQACAAQGAPMGSPNFDACMKQELSREASTRREAAERRKRGPVVCNQSFGTLICN